MGDQEKVQPVELCFSHYTSCQSSFSHRCKIQLWLLSAAWASEICWTHPNNKVSKVLVTWIENVIAYRFKKQNKTQSIWIKACYGCLDRDFSWICTWWMRRTMSLCHKGLSRRWLWVFLSWLVPPLILGGITKMQANTKCGNLKVNVTSAFQVFHSCSMQPLHRAFVSVKNYKKHMTKLKCKGKVVFFPSHFHPCCNFVSLRLFSALAANGTGSDLIVSFQRLPISAVLKQSYW